MTLERNELPTALDIPDVGGLVLCSDDSSAFGVKRGLDSRRLLVPLQGGQLPAVAAVPDAHRAVPRCCHDALTRGAERCAVHNIGVPRQCGELLSALGIPDAGGVVTFIRSSTRRSHDTPAFAVEIDALHCIFVAFQNDQLAAAGN